MICIALVKIFNFPTGYVEDRAFNRLKRTWEQTTKRTWEQQATNCGDGITNNKKFMVLT